jgi:RNA polymerase sigma-70 factor (ECF subfamily)
MTTLAMAHQPTADFDLQYAALFGELTTLCRAVGAGDEAQDIAQDVLLYGRSHLGQLRDTTKLRPWLRKMAVRAVGKRRSTSTVSLDAIGVGYFPTDTGLSLDSMAAIRSLPERERIAIVLTYGLGYDQAAVAELMDIRRGTVAATLWKARQKLARALAPTE